MEKPPYSRDELLLLVSQQMLQLRQFPASLPIDHLLLHVMGEVSLQWEPKDRLQQLSDVLTLIVQTIEDLRATQRGLIIETLEELCWTPTFKKP